MHPNSSPSRAQAGVSIPEAAMAAALVLAVLGMLATGAGSLARGSQTNDAELKRASSQRNALAVLQHELEASSIRNGRFQIASDRHSIRFTRLVGADLAGSEVSGTWSTDIEIGLRPPGNLVRIQDGQTALLATGLSDLAISQPAGSDCFEVTVSSRGAPRGGVATTVTRTVRIFPKN